MPAAGTARRAAVSDHLPGHITPCSVHYRLLASIPGAHVQNERIRRIFCAHWSTTITESDCLTSAYAARCSVRAAGDTGYALAPLPPRPPAISPSFAAASAGHGSTCRPVMTRPALAGVRVRATVSSPAVLRDHPGDARLHRSGIAPAPGKRRHPTTVESLNHADQAICLGSNSRGPAAPPGRDTVLACTAYAPRGTEPRPTDQDPHKSPQPERPTSPYERHPTHAFTQVRGHIIGEVFTFGPELGGRGLAGVPPTG
jgi:hypothetical protein